MSLGTLRARHGSIEHVDYVWRLSNVSGVKRITILFPSRILCSLRFLLFHDEATELARHLFCVSRIEIYATSDVRVARMLSARENSSHVDYVWRLSNVSGVKRITILFPSRVLCSLRFLRFHDEELLSYMKLLNVPLGLLLNFHELMLVDGLSRLVLPGANQP